MTSQRTDLDPTTANDCDLTDNLTDTGYVPTEQDLDDYRAMRATGGDCPVTLSSWVYDDGGRALAGFRGTAGDCVCRAISIASGRPYAEIYQLLNETATTERGRKRRGKVKRSSARTGVFTPTARKVIAELGGVWHPTMQIGLGCKVHLRAEELPVGRLVCSLSRHLVAVVDGVVRDLEDPSRGGTRCVYGYWVFT